MKRRFLCLAAALMMLLTACGAQDTAPALQLTLSDTGVTAAFYGCTVEEATTDFRMDDAQTPETACLYAADGRPDLCLSGVTAEEVEVRFAEPYEAGMRLYTGNTPVEKLDYTLSAGEDGVSIRFKTVYYYLITVTTDAGTDRFVVTTALE